MPYGNFESKVIIIMILCVVGRLFLSTHLYMNII